MPHLMRAAGLLIAALVIGLAIRSVLTPDPLLLSSTYRQENVGEWTGESWPVRLVGATYCGDCHREIASRWQASRHQTVTCEDCHGMTQPHVEHKASLVIDTSREFCGTCHAENSTRPPDFPQVDLTQHWVGTACAACHNPHDPWAYRPSKITHAVAGNEACLGCHGATANPPRAVKRVPADHASYPNNGCLSCHQTR